MRKLLSTITAPVLVAAIASALIAPTITGVINYRANETIGREAKIRETRLAELLKFQSSGDPMLAALSAYVSAVGRKAEISKPTSDLESEILKQVNASNALKATFSTKPALVSITQYQEALVQFSKSIKETKDVGESPLWEKAFSDVYSTRENLQNTLALDAGLRSS